MAIESVVRTRSPGLVRRVQIWIRGLRLLGVRGSSLVVKGLAGGGWLGHYCARYEQYSILQRFGLVMISALASEVPGRAKVESNIMVEAKVSGTGIRLSHLRSSFVPHAIDAHVLPSTQ